MVPTIGPEYSLKRRGEPSRGVPKTVCSYQRVRFKCRGRERGQISMLESSCVRSQAGVWLEEQVRGGALVQRRARLHELELCNQL